MKGLTLFLLLAPYLASCATFSNQNLIVEKPPIVSEGSSATFQCELPIASSQLLNTCQFTTPLGGRLTVLDDQVVDSDSGQVVPGYVGVGWNRPGEICGIEVLIVDSSHMGDWTCIINRTNGATEEVVGVINIRRENQNPQDVRLPEDFTPISYNLDLIAVWDPDWIIDGFFSMSGISRTQDPTTKVYLSFSDMSFDENSIVVSSDGTELVILEHIYDFERSIYAIRYEPPGTEYNLEVSGRYEAYLKRRVLGFNRDFYTDVVTGEDVFLAVTQFEPNGARHAFPCMDEPALKAKFTVRLGHLDSLGARTNMPLVATGAPVDGYQGYVWSEFEESELMSPYLNAFLISDYVEVASTPLENGLPHSIWTRYDAVDDGLAEYIRVLGPEIIYAYEQYFQVDFTLPKMDQTSVPTKGGAMENWGLITYREDEVLIDPTLSSANAEHTLVSVEAHEIAHQWFGDLVTCDWWSYIWLNEGFATYVSYIGSEAVKPEMKNFELFVYLDLNDALRIDSLPSSHEISQETNTPESANFGPISYSKGGSLIRMVEAFLTTSAWKTGLTNYLNAKSLSTAVPDDLFYYWNEASMSEGILGDSHDVVEIMNTWTLQKNYPLLTVTRDYLMGTATVTQERYLTREDNSGDTHDYKWWIPITYSSVNDENSNFDDTFNNDLWLTPDDEELVVGTGAENSAVIFNVQYTGFYRVNYDSENWDRIADALKADHTSIHTINRAQLLADSFDFSDHGIIAEDYSVPLKIAQYLGTETEYIPLCFANDIFLALERHVLPLSPTAQALDDFIFNVFLDKYNAMEMDEHPDYTFQENLVQRIVVDAMCRVDQADCVNDALIRFNAWMSSPNPDDLSVNPINRQVRVIVYCTAVRNGDTGDEIPFLLERRQNTRDPQERDNLSVALACVPKLDRLVQFLREVVRSPFEYKAEYLISNLLSNKLTTQALGILAQGSDVAEHLSKDLADTFANVLSIGRTEEELKVAQRFQELYEEKNGFKSYSLEMAESSILGHLERNLRIQPLR